VDFRSFCDNKSCRKEMRPVVDPTTLEAHCTECGEKVENISIFMRRQMAAQGQVKKLDKKRLAWAIKCLACSQEGPPELTNNKLTCCFCKEELKHVPKPFADVVKNAIRTKGTE
jgi:hypothetical protein